MGGAIIGLNASTAKNVAPSADLEALFNYLDATLGRYFIINGYGEALGPSAARPWTLTGTGSVTEFVQQPDNVFIDYCGWPMSWLVNTAGYESNPGPVDFQTFGKALGYDWLSAASFQAGVKTGSNGHIFPFERGFNQSGALNGLYLPHGTFTALGGKWDLNGGGYAAMLGIHREGIGWYFWGTSYHSFINSLFGPAGYPKEVPPNVYGAFIEACVHGQSSAIGSNFTLTISHEPYTVNPTAPQKNTTGPSSPYTGSTAPGPSGSTTTKTYPSGSSSTSSLPTVCPSGYQLVNGQCVLAPSTTPSWLKPAVGIGLIVAGGGGVWYLGKQEGWWRKNGSKPQS